MVSWRFERAVLHEAARLRKVVASSVPWRPMSVHQCAVTLMIRHDAAAAWALLQRNNNSSSRQRYNPIDVPMKHGEIFAFNTRVLCRPASLTKKKNYERFATKNTKDLG
jgi:hypothetical protein